VRLRHTRLLLAAWVAVFVAAGATLNAAKAPVLITICAGIAAVLGLIVIALLTAAELRDERQMQVAQADAPAIHLSLRDRDELIERVWSQRITNGLERSLQHAVEMQLGLREAPELIKLSFQQTPGRTGDRVDLVGAYETSGRQLVILGAPGSGKTTQALLLMRHLLDVARRDPSAPVPEVFQLPSWARERKPLLDWLTDELRRRHGYRPNLGRSLLVHHHIVPVLDGLDEVAGELRAACIMAITGFWENHGGRPIILCSRVKEYEELPERLPFGGAVTVDPPSDEQVQHYLAGAGPAWDPVRASLAAGDNPALSELLATPLMLSVAVLAYDERDPSVLCANHDAPAQVRLLWAAYVQQMHTRRYDPVQPSTTTFTEDQTVRWFSWLAWAMRETNETELWLHAWVGPQSFLKKVNLTSRLVTGLILALYGTLVTGVILGQGGGLATAAECVLVGIVGGTVMFSASPAYRVPFDLQKVAVRLREVLLLGLGGGLLMGLVSAGLTWGLLPGLVEGLAAGVAGGLGGGLFGALVGGLFSGGLADIGPDRTRLAVRLPTQVIADSARLGLVGVFIGSLCGGLSTGLVGALVGGVKVGVPAVVGGQLRVALLGASAGVLLGGLGGGVLAGLGAVWTHYVYRFLLWYNGWAPLRWPRFLDWACSHLYLRSTGPAYQWVHVELRNYLADVYAASPTAQRLR
jgi:hypothetical protein